MAVPHVPMQEIRPPTQQENLRHAHYIDYSVVLQGDFFAWVCVLMDRLCRDTYTCTAFFVRPAGCGP